MAFFHPQSVGENPKLTDTNEIICSYYLFWADVFELLVGHSMQFFRDEIWFEEVIKAKLSVVKRIYI